MNFGQWRWVTLITGFLPHIPVPGPAKVVVPHHSSPFVCQTECGFCTSTGVVPEKPIPSLHGTRNPIATPVIQPHTPMVAYYLSATHGRFSDMPTMARQSISHRRSEITKAHINWHNAVSLVFLVFILSVSFIGFRIWKSMLQSQSK